MARRTKVVSVTIANGASLSGALLLNGWSVVAVKMPAAWTAAGMTFQVSDDQGVTYDELLGSDGNAVALVVAANNRVNLPSPGARGATAIKVRSGTSGTPVNQGAARTISLVLAYD